MKIDEMTLEEIEARLAEISEENLESRSEDELSALNQEIVELNARKAELVDIEKRQELAAQIKNNAVKAKTIEERKEEKTMMTMAEFRNDPKYIDAYAEYLKKEDDTELRALLTENVEDGTIAVPDFVLDIVKTAWDKNEIMSLVNKVSIAGNLKVNFEISGGDAVIHTEGGDAVTEETLTHGIVTLTPASIKKWIAISDEAMDLRGDVFLRYIYDEIAYRIVKKMADQLVGLVAALPQVATATTPNAAKITAAPALGTVASGIANLSDEASNPVIVMNKLTWSEFKSAQYSGNFSVDPFEGLRVVFNNSLPAYSSASAGAIYMIIGDFRQGALANFPNGEGINFKFDEMSRKKEDLVEILGREYVALGVVAPKAFTLVAKPSQG